jgi:hypothetical protein
MPIGTGCCAASSIYIRVLAIGRPMVARPSARR